MPTRIERDEVQRLVAQDGAQLAEVLPAAEYDEVHLAGAINLPLKQLDKKAAQALDPTRPIIVYCNDHL
jgi:rhodanese-related sulfurtransferase